jgi:hypothetical protein
MPTHTGHKQTEQTSLNYQKRRNISRKFQQVEVDISMTMQDPLKQVKVTEVAFMTVQMMILITFCPTLTIFEVSPDVQL